MDGQLATGRWTGEEAGQSVGANAKGIIGRPTSNCVCKQGQRKPAHA